MKRLALLAACCVLSTPAWAWDNTQTGGPNSIADGGGQSQAQAAFGGRAAAHSAASSASISSAHGGGAHVVNRVTVNGANGSSGSSVAYPGGGSNTTTLYYQRQVPSPYAPSLITANPCSAPIASGGVTLPIFGIALGGNRMDRVCQLHEIGRDDVAFQLLCQDDDVRQAAKGTAEACRIVSDRHPVVPARPAHRPAYCDTYQAGRDEYHPECKEPQS